jgi:MFS family permease
MMGESLMDDAKQPSPKEIRTLIAASSMGTAFEWYDFYIYGTLAPLFGKLFFPGSSPAAGFLLALATFGVGFAVRPLGGAVFGAFGDRFGRKRTFLATVMMMGLATTAIGLLGTYAQIGIAAPILLVLLRALQGLAVGGEYGGAAIYVAEHAPPEKRGLYTGFIQIGASAGFMLSLLAVLTTNALVGEEAWLEWGWRIPFLLSLILLAISVWMRLKLSESPVFQAMRAAGEVARHPLKEAFSSMSRFRRLLAVMFGIAVGQSICGYVGLIQVLNFLQVSQHLDPTLTRIVMIIALTISAVMTLLCGWLSDKIGRKRPVLLGYVLFLLLVFPVFHMLAGQANPALAAASRDNPVVVSGADCDFNPFAQSGQASACGRLLDTLTKKGIPYSKIDSAAAATPSLTIGGKPADASNPEALAAQLLAAGYSLDPVKPSGGALVLIALGIIALNLFGGLAYGPVGAWMVELFPARTRYSSLAISYNFGVGYFAGFMPFIVQYIVATTGDPYAGFWYPVAMVAIAGVVALFGLPETAGKKIE